MRKIKQNIWGNWNGYEGRNRVQQFGTDEISAAYWALTGEVNFNAGYAAEWLARCQEAIKSV
jgi:hypothetical protein